VTRAAHPRVTSFAAAHTRQTHEQGGATQQEVAMIPAEKNRIRTLPVAILVSGAFALPFGACGSKDAHVPGSAVTEPQAPVSVTQAQVPEPPTWSFPDVIEAARAIAPQNVDGRTFDQHGLAYSPETLDALPVATMSALELQKYADVVTHAYPDAVFRQVPASCQGPALDQANATAIAGIAYVSLHAIDPATRKRATTCLDEVQQRRREQLAPP